MLGMFLNRRDADAASYDTHLRTMEIMEEDHQARMAGIERLGDLDNRKRIIERQIQELNLRVAEGNARAAMLRAVLGLTGVESGEKLEAMRYQASRFLDVEIDRWLKSGRLTSDPRQNPAWREGEQYRPA